MYTMKIQILFLALSTILCVTAQDDDCNADWSNGPAHTCVLYAGQGWCTSDGEYGAGWSESWGTFEDFARVDDGTTGWVCPQCGCGQGADYIYETQQGYCRDGTGAISTIQQDPAQYQLVNTGVVVIQDCIDNCDASSICTGVGLPLSNTPYTSFDDTVGYCELWSHTNTPTNGNYNKQYECLVKKKVCTEDSDCASWYDGEYCRDGKCTTAACDEGTITLIPTEALECTDFCYEISWELIDVADQTTVCDNYDVECCLNADSCYQLNMMDSWGDGWGGAILHIGEEDYELVSGDFETVFLPCATTTAKPTPKPTEEVTEADAEAACCTIWSAECYTTASSDNNNHACKDCGYAVEHCDNVCSSGSYKSGDLADSDACKECCQGYDHEISWNCPASDDGCNPDWNNDGSHTCTTYAENEWCTSDGEYGAGWMEHFGTIESFGNAAGESAWVCPECGCGQDTAGDDDDDAEAACCTIWSAECYTTASSDNNNHACKDCGYAVEHCDNVCSSGSYKSGDLADSDACKECCQGYDHEISWNCPASAGDDDDDACVHVTHVEDVPGVYTCDCVSDSDPCLSDGACVQTDSCPSMDGQATADCVNMDNEADCEANDICVAKTKKNGSFKKCKYKTCGVLKNDEETCALHYNCRTKYNKKGVYKGCKKIGPY